MKKYIKPVQRIYSVSTSSIIALSTQAGEAIDSQDVKEEKTNGGSGIWDLYN